MSWLAPAVSLSYHWVIIESEVIIEFWFQFLSTSSHLKWPWGDYCSLGAFSTGPVRAHIGSLTWRYLVRRRIPLFWCGEVPGGKMWSKGHVSVLLVVKILGICGTTISWYRALIVWGMDESSKWITCSGDILSTLQSKSSKTKCVVALSPVGTILRRSSRVHTSTGRGNSAKARCVFPQPGAPESTYGHQKLNARHLRWRWHVVLARLAHHCDLWRSRMVRSTVALGVGGIFMLLFGEAEVQDLHRLSIPVDASNHGRWVCIAMLQLWLILWCCDMLLRVQSCRCCTCTLVAVCEYAPTVPKNQESSTLILPKLPKTVHSTHYRSLLIR